MPDVELTELIEIDPSRVDGVKNPASGLPILLMKALSDPAEPVDTPDTSGTETVKETEVSEDTQTPPAEAPEVTEPVVEKSAAELAEEAVAKAVQPLQEVIKGLRDEMAALKSTPIPGGPVVTVPSAQRDRSEQAHLAAEAARFRRLAKEVSDQELVQFYEKKATQAEKAAQA